MTVASTKMVPIFFVGYTVIGFAMYYFTYDPWIGKLLYLEDFYVMEEFRGKCLVKTFPGVLTFHFNKVYPLSSTSVL